ncbi:MAG: NUDIX domain-containing protein [Chloroflexota bacterium]|jgi:8-oxo-dGTP diphosphatase|nr:NUDIX domain-containing protein [Chloroflexota bacterium]PKB59827.1 MAG: hypothetical protein BZY65_03045 [SAR202 cluster bacterium Ae2-Chloro-G2]|tara:strand:+ start:5632 stop:6462 length:831 start_codon:yes stop_codon:yes gene_type:complete
MVKSPRSVALPEAPQYTSFCLTIGGNMSELIWSVNPFGGAVIDPNSVSSTVTEFASSLLESVPKWRDENIKVAWLEIPKGSFSAIATASEEGFLFHHATEDYAMMTLQVEEDAFVPPYATHYIGIGGVVINQNRELLVVSERYRAAGRGPGYKLPGGALQPGEHLAEAAVREVYEETGISTTFEALTFFRHWHGYRYGKSDIYFVARLSPLDNDITMQEEEIAECLWMPVDQFLNEESVHLFNKTIVRSATENEGLKVTPINGYEPADKFEFFMPH